MKASIFKLMAMLCIAVVTSGFVSCGDDDDGVKIDKNKLIGTWQEYKTEYYDLDGNLLRTYDTPSYYYYTFDADGTLHTTSYSMLKEYANDDETSTWKLKGDKLVLYGDEFYRIKKLTDEELVLEMKYADQGYEEDYNPKEDEITYYRRVSEK